MTNKKQNVKSAQKMCTSGQTCISCFNFGDLIFVHFGVGDAFSDVILIVPWNVSFCLGWVLCIGTILKSTLNNLQVICQQKGQNLSAACKLLFSNVAG